MSTLKQLQRDFNFNTDKDRSPSHEFKGKTYLDVYDTIFPHVRLLSGHVMEIGVLFGGSLRLLHEYFGGKVVGVDIDPTRKQFESPNDSIFVETGSQGDVAFLDSVRQKHGEFRLILDDGSHVVNHMITSFNALWPHLKSGGIYIMEDLRVTYYGPDGGWPGMSYNNQDELKCDERPMFDRFLLDLIRRMDHHEGDVRRIEFHPMIVAIHKV